MNMKWTMSFLALSGALAYALIFLAQSDGDSVVAEAEVPARPTLPSVAEPLDVAPTVTADLPDTSSDEVVTVSEVPADAEAPHFEDPWQAGVNAFEAGQLETAVAALEASIEQRPNSAYRHFLLGLTFRRLGRSDAAVTELQRSRTLAPDDVKTLVALGRAELDAGSPEAAREAVDRALEVDIDAADAWQVLGRIESTLGNFDEAEAAFRGAVDRDPAHAWAWNNLGYLYIQREQFDAARDALLHAVQSPHADAVFYNNLGVAFERTDDLSRAALAYAKADLLGSESSTVNHERVATILEARGLEVATADSVETLDDATVLAALQPDVDESEAEVAQLDPTSETFETPADESKE